MSQCDLISSRFDQARAIPLGGMVNYGEICEQLGAFQHIEREKAGKELARLAKEGTTYQAVCP
jgi:hypothetical protein